VEIAWKSRANQLAFALTRRLAGILIPLGFSFGDFSNAAKSGFVAATEALIKSRGKRPSTARIAILTGLTRAEVARIRSGKSPSSRASTDQRTERVMHGWFTDPRYIDERGAPRQLNMMGTGSFDELVKRYGADVPRKAVLEELITGGMAVLEESGVVRALRRHRVAPPTSNLDLARLSKDLEIVFVSSEVRGSEPSPALRRITVQFSGPIPNGVRRTVSTRTERFIEALADYLHSEPASSAAHDSNANRTGPSFSILIAQCESNDKE
jgi:hypothetical protein